MTMDDDEVERYLTELQPRPVRELDLPRRANGPFWLAATLVLILICLFGALRMRQGKNPGQDVARARPAKLTPALPSVGAKVIKLTNLALEDPERFDAILSTASRSVLPSFQEENSTLRVLAKE